MSNTLHKEQLSDYSYKGLEQDFDKIDLLIKHNKLNEARKIFLELHYADAADYLDNKHHDFYYSFLYEISESLNPELLVALHDSNKEEFICAIGEEKIAKLIEQLDIEDAIEVIESIKTQTKDKILESLSQKRRYEIVEGFLYPENTAGRLIEKTFFCLSAKWTVAESIYFLKKNTQKKEFYAAVVIDSKNKPVGTIMLSQLINSSDDEKISHIMNKDIKTASAHTEIDELVFIFKQYALTIVPIVNKMGRIIGIVSVDNMIYVVEEQTENDLLSIGGINTTDIFSRLYQTVKTRFPWLFINLITACITSIIINQFSDTISQMITVATIMPIVASMAGNAGTQTMTVTIRAISNREINSHNANKILFKEICVSFINGLILAFIGAILTWILFKNSSLSIVFFAAIVINFVIAGFCGSSIPIVLENLDIDPASASGVFLTACTDSLGFAIFLGLVKIFLI